MLDGLVLDELTRGPAHGYALRRSFARRGIDVAGGTLYSVLRRLERDGLLAGKWQDGRTRRVYRITRAGREALHVRRLELRTSP